MKGIHKTTAVGKKTRLNPSDTNRKMVMMDMFRHENINEVKIT